MSDHKIKPGAGGRGVAFLCFFFSLEVFKKEKFVIIIVIVPEMSSLPPWPLCIWYDIMFELNLAGKKDVPISEMSEGRIWKI